MVGPATDCSCSACIMQPPRQPAKGSDKTAANTPSSQVVPVRAAIFPKGGHQLFLGLPATFMLSFRGALFPSLLLPENAQAMESDSMSLSFLLLIDSAQPYPSQGVLFLALADSRLNLDLVVSAS